MYESGFTGLKDEQDLLIDKIKKRII